MLLCKVYSSSCEGIKIHTVDFRYLEPSIIRTSTRSNFHFPSDSFLYNFTLDNSNFSLFPLKVRIIWSRLYIAINKSIKALYKEGISTGDLDKFGNVGPLLLASSFLNPNNERDWFEPHQLNPIWRPTPSVGLFNPL